MGSSGGMTSTLSGAQRRISGEIARFLAPRPDGKGSFAGGPNRIGMGAAEFDGQLIADLTPEQQRARQLLAEYDPTQFDTMSAAVVQRTLEGRPSFDLSEQTTKDFFQKGVADPLLKTFDEQIAPRIKQDFARVGGAFSSRRNMALGDAAEDLNSQLAAQLSGMQFNNQALRAGLAESAAQRQTQGLALAEGFANRNLLRGSLLNEAGTPFQAWEQSKLGAAYQEFQRTAPENSPWLQNALQFAGQGVRTYKPPNPWEQAFAQAAPNAAAGGAGALAGLLLL